MSQENVEIIRGLLARWERGETTTTVGAFTHRSSSHGPAVVLTFSATRRNRMAWTDEWTDVSVRAEDFTEVGARVLVLARQRAVGRHSGVPMSNLDAWVFSFRGGRIVRWDAYWNPAEARRALGIEE
jgi:ketosteroid isomerase-like protein